jgi:N-acetylmuramoyl-L-alanine amidase
MKPIKSLAIPGFRLTTGKWLKRCWLSLFLLFTACCRPTGAGSDLRCQRVPITTTRPGVLICLDAGHGGKDSGCKSVDEEWEEKNLTLATTLMTRNHLQSLGYQVILTRNDDTFVELPDRAKIANEQHCTLFVSIHYNAADNRDAQGVEVFCFRKQASAEQPTEAACLADGILKRIIGSTHAPSRGVKEAEFVVLKRTSMPAVLVEGGFLTNDEECQRLSQPRYLNAVAWGISQGIHSYLK